MNMGPLRAFHVLELLSLLLIFRGIACVRIRHSTSRLHHGMMRFNGHQGVNGSGGLWPSVFNVATKATITANATCGERGREEFCRLADHGRGKCGICDSESPDPGKRHPVQNAIDGTNRWWQSPSLHYGSQYESVAITLDLKQVYQVVYVIVKAANAPRPGSWILERSVDGVHYSPWQYYVINDEECLQVHGIPPTPGRPRYFTDTDVICTSYYSKLHPLENGEIHTSLINGRPGANESSPELLEFTRARYVRLRLLRHRATNVATTSNWHGVPALGKRLYYAIRDISIGGQCVCSGHATSCRHNVASGHPECECEHHTCGPNCEKCCPLFNQRPWGPGSGRNSRACEQCQCHGHATQCIYDEQVEAAGLSVDIHGLRRGGGVCVNCTNFTAGINCEKCLPGYFRPPGVVPPDAGPCISCDCDKHGTATSGGTSGECIQEPAEKAGQCVCRPEYTGYRCDRCAPGYSGYPRCIICPCDVRGTLPGDDCSEDCLCKVNVEGERCDICKSGHFALRSANFEGCSVCYCSGVTSVCESAFLSHETIDTLEDWQVTDISTTQTIRPSLDTDTNWLSIGNYEIPSIEAYYWLAPFQYSGNRLENYGSVLAFTVNWVVMRGDTSGKPTTGPNIVLIGSNGLRIAHGDSTFSVTNATIRVPLQEENWYHIPYGVKDIVTRLRRTEYRGDPVTRFQFMSILKDLKHLMLRAKFHTDQIEGSLENAKIFSEDGGAQVEKCACPNGYTGWSCERCDYGYVQMVLNTSSHLEQNVCVKCNCNGHSSSCETDGGGCKCEHNTVGKSCERCAPGYYGNPLSGTVNDCKKCACPLLEEGNNFSPSCQLDTLSEEEDVAGEAYVCTQCPQGYTGDHCEICDYGFFGSPISRGGTCELCSCNGGPCDRTSGQCLSCRGNTEGWRCERCKAQHYGDAAASNCQPCLCDPVGSVGPDCDPLTGQCQCKDKFIGRICDRCQEGYGNVSAGCPACSCHAVGAVTNTCDRLSGVCSCKPGVEGFRCDACQHLHYGFSEQGCLGCACNIAGSELTTCDIVTGQCRCKAHVIGRNCDSCETGYWGLDSGKGCFKCDCDEIGSTDGTCDQRTKQCYCKPGVGGLKCDDCLLGFFGFSDRGCKACDYCVKPGHVCDPDTGRCVCPPNSRGESCERCAPNSYGLETGIGCKLCACTLYGSLKKQCDLRTGQCECKTGYSGTNCDRCSFGYYGYPRCRRCDCDRAGTEGGRCDTTGLCQCHDETGQCACKTNVVGRRCNECSNGTFGLHLDNPDGCTQCFCFGRTAHCTESNLTIGHIRLNTSRELEIEYAFRNQYVQPFHKHLSTENDLWVIPGIYDDKIRIEVNSGIDKPLYWRLPSEFLGDKILSYGGYLRFVAETSGGTNTLPYNKFPLVQIRGNDKIVLEHFQLLPSPHNRHEIRFHESLWKWKGYPNVLVSRDVLMVTLQRVQHILIRANNAVNFDKVVLNNVTLDTAIMLPGSPPPLAKGVELCECPRQYNSSSCQNPSIGFYRWYNPELVNGTIVISLIGDSKPCECNGRSTVCHTETGYCLNCTDNTTGSNCQYCSEGFYGNPLHGKCKPCPCPSKERNFSRKCHRLHHGAFKCICKTGYSGPKCDKCKSGYFGNPEQDGGSCRSCNCNKYGSASDECDQETGQCNCRPGMTGKDCSLCESFRHVLQITGCKPCDNCTQWLLNDLDQMSDLLNKVHTEYILYDRIRQFYDRLNEMQNSSTDLQNNLNNYQFLQKTLLDFPLEDVKKLQNQSLKLKNKNLLEPIHKIQTDVAEINGGLNDLFSNIDDVERDIKKTIKDLQNFGTKHVEVKNAVRQGRKLLEEIKKVPVAHPEFSSRLEKCRSILDGIKKMDTSYAFSPRDIQMDLEDFCSRLKDVKQFIVDSLRNAEETQEKNVELMKRIRSLKDKIEKLNSVGFESVNETSYFLSEARKLFKEAKENSVDLKDSREFHQLVKKLEDQLEGQSDVSVSELAKLLKFAKKHVDLLQRASEEYRKSFNIPHEADLALKASKAYQDIIDILNESKNIAQKAVETINKAEKVINPDGEKSLYEDSVDALTYSEKLRKSAERLKSSIDVLNEKKEILNISISDSQNIIWRTGLNDNLLNSNLHNLTLNKKDMLAVIHTANAISNKMKEIYKNATKIKEEIKYRLRPELDKLQKVGVEVVSLGEEKLSVAERNIKTSLDILIGLETNNHVRKSNLTKWNDTISRKLDELKNRILKAKQTADGIRVSLTNAENSVCSRSYKPYNFGPTTTTNLALTIFVNNTDKNSSIFYLPTASQDFMALQLVNKKIQYLWNLGGDTGELNTPLPKDSQNDTWYKIKVERTANFARLIVYNKGIEDNPVVKEGYTSADFTQFDLGPEDRFWIGGSLKTNYPLQTNKMVAETGLTGCLSDVVFDGKPIGLWNFVTSTDACTNCNKNGLDGAKSDNCCYFNGIGYSVVPRDNTAIYKRSSTSIRFDFKTFDENALLFLAVDIPNKRFVSIYLKNGKVQFHIEYGGRSVLILTTDKKYNTGSKVLVTAGRVFSKYGGERGNLKVNDEIKDGNPMTMPDKNSFPDLSDAKFYIGGVPPEFFFESNGTTETLHTHASFLGCIQDILVDGSRYDPLDERYYERYGVEPSCANKQLKMTGFEGAGFIKMPKQQISSNSSFGFVFRTLQKDALLIASIENHENDYYSVSVIEGKLEVRLKAGNKQVTLTSNKTVNDGHYHVAFVKFHKKRVVLRIDDVPQDEKHIDLKNFEINEDVYFGGLPSHFNHTKKVPTVVYLIGTIKDVIFNNRLLVFNGLESFERVKIGRVGPLPDKAAPMEVSTLMMPAPAGVGAGAGAGPSGRKPDACHRIASYSLELGAVKFGDAPHSFLQHLFKSSNFWNRNFSIQLEFRTFYQNGFIFLSPGLREKNRHYILLTLKEHSIHLIVKGKRKKEIVLTQKYENREWHQIIVASSKKKLSLTVDGNTAFGKFPKKINVANMIYIGGIPANGSHLPESFVNKLHAFRGCIRGLKLNNINQDLISDASYHNNVGQCFPHVEKGSYFAGDAFAVYKSNFAVSAQLELQFEFRTSEQQGILLSISDPVTKHGLSLELFNGSVVMMGNMGSGGPSKVETNLSTEFSLCDNRWHKVSALYSKDEMTVNVDGVVRSSLAINASFMEIKVENALYIGGLPDNAPLGTLHTRENFKGCIRNVVIEHRIIDWTDMDSLQNILLNSCPVTDL